MTQVSGSPPAPAASDEALAARLQQALVVCARSKPRLARERWINARCQVGIGDSRLLLAVEHGTPSVIDDVPLLCECDFIVRGSNRAWSELWQPVPAPGWHDLFALYKRGELQIEGNLQPFMANLEYFKDLLASPRRLAQ